MFGVSEKVLDKLQQFAEPAIEVSRAEMNRIIKETKFRYMRIWTTKLSGVRMRRMMETRNPTGNPPSYDYKAKGYWVLWDQNARNWRTVVLRNVEKIKIGNQFYKIK
jgi:hypothetical protein